MAARILSVASPPVDHSDDDHQTRLAAFARVVLERVAYTPLHTYHARTAGSLVVDLLRDAHRFDLLDDNYGGRLR